MEPGLVVVSAVSGASLVFLVSSGCSLGIPVQNMHAIVWMDPPHCHNLSKKYQADTLPK